NILKGEPKSAHWNYESEGPDFWKEEFLNCRGEKQSPIDIAPDYLKYDPNLKPLNFINYEKYSNWNVSHNGHTVTVKNVNDEIFSINGSDFNKKFNLLQFHFHWGYNNFQGSEHQIDGEKFPLEMHLVHKSTDGNYTVLGFLFKLSSERNKALDSLLYGVDVARKAGFWQNVSFQLKSFLPDLKNLDYYRYIGSLTTPPCSEGIIWNVFTTYINISSDQMEHFRRNQLRINFRDPQKIFNRDIYTSFKVETGKLAKSHFGQQCIIHNQSKRLKSFIIGTILPVFCAMLYKFIN
ncbi:carbonic anhydrase 7, partial [Brachionus plicatilis]